jgi:hypothetical protein
MRENERFSPIPYVFSPPDSPPPLSLYTSVALLHYHIHQAPQTPVTPLPGLTAAVVGREMTEDGILSSESQSPVSSRSRTSSTGNSPPKTTKVLPADQALEEFIAVEAALTRSPYILPRDMLPTTSGVPHGVGTTKVEDAGVELDKVKNEASDQEEKVRTDEELARQIEETEDVLSELVEGYSLDDEGDVKSLRSVPSSPFIEFTTPRIPVVESRPVTASSSQRLHESISTNTTTETEPITNSTTTEEPKQETNEQSLTVPSDETTAITRMPSIQRRGKEYLEQFLAKRTRKSTKTPSTKPNKPTNTIPPMTIFLSLCIALSLLTNIILITVVLRNQTPFPPSEAFLKPARIDDTFEIFTPSEATSQWWKWGPWGEKVVTTVPASTQIVRKGKRESWVISKVWMRKPDNLLKVQEDVVGKVEGEGVRRRERRYVWLWGRTRVFINEILGRVFGV